MTPLGIILLIVGALVIVASFFVPDKEDREDKQDMAKKQEQIRRLMERELDGMKLRVNEATNETVEVGMEKSERALEKITNEKIMAVSEYATTVMEEIDRNHKEVMFLYDMLSDKQTDVKNTVRHAEATVKEVTDAAKTASDTAIYATNVANAANEAVSAVEASVLQASLNAAEVPAPAPKIPEQTSAAELGLFNEINAVAPTQSVFSMAAQMEDFNVDTPLMDEVENISPIVPVIEEPEEEKELSEFELLEKNTSFNNINNNNQMILKLSAEGVPVVDIARQLSLGVGEVQLVIDLFK